MKKIAIAILVPIFAGLFAEAGHTYLQVKELVSKEMSREKQLDRIEIKIDKIQGYLIERKPVIIKERSK